MLGTHPLTPLPCISRNSTIRLYVVNPYFGVTIQENDPLFGLPLLLVNRKNIHQTSFKDQTPKLDEVT